MDTTLGNIILAAFSFAPKGWMFCNVQILDIRTNTALYSLLGTRFGGDGKTSFALPDLRGRITNETSIIARLDEGTEAAPMADGYLAVSTPTGNLVSNIYRPAQGPGGTVQLAASTGQASFSTSVNNAGTGSGAPLAAAVTTTATGAATPPFLAMQYLIANEGYYPMRN